MNFSDIQILTYKHLHNKIIRENPACYDDWSFSNIRSVQILKYGSALPSQNQVSTWYTNMTVYEIKNAKNFVVFLKYEKCLEFINSKIKQPILIIQIMLHLHRL